MAFLDAYDVELRKDLEKAQWNLDNQETAAYHATVECRRFAERLVQIIAERHAPTISLLGIDGHVLDLKDCETLLYQKGAIPKDIQEKLRAIRLAGNAVHINKTTNATRAGLAISRSKEVAFWIDNHFGPHERRDTKSPRSESANAHQSTSRGSSDSSWGAMEDSFSPRSYPKPSTMLLFIVALLLILSFAIIKFHLRFANGALQSTDQATLRTVGLATLGLSVMTAAILMRKLGVLFKLVAALIATYFFIGVVVSVGGWVLKTADSINRQVIAPAEQWRSQITRNENGAATGAQAANEQAGNHIAPISAEAPAEGWTPWYRLPDGEMRWTLYGSVRYQCGYGALEPIDAQTKDSPCSNMTWIRFASTTGNSEHFEFVLKPIGP